MRINPINSINQTMCQRKNNSVRNNISQNQNVSLTTADKLTFKGFGGKVAGGLIGAGLAGLGVLATVATGGLAGIALFAVAETGGAVIGGAVGDAITGKDKDEENK